MICEMVYHLKGDCDKLKIYTIYLKATIKVKKQSYNK